jgi:hypothetical protein
MKIKKLLKFTVPVIGVLSLGLLAGCAYGPAPYYSSYPAYSSCYNNPYARCYYSSQYYYSAYPAYYYRTYPGYYYY